RRHTRFSRDWSSDVCSSDLLNSLGYKLLDEGRYMEAIYVFRLNVGLYPNSSNVFYSLGEGYYRAGDRDKAVRCYEKALELDPARSEERRVGKECRATRSRYA